MHGIRSRSHQPQKDLTPTRQTCMGAQYILPSVFTMHGLVFAMRSSYFNMHGLVPAVHGPCAPCTTCNTLPRLLPCPPACLQALHLHGSTRSVPHQADQSLSSYQQHMLPSHIAARPNLPPPSPKIPETMVLAARMQPGSPRKLQEQHPLLERETVGISEPLIEVIDVLFRMHSRGVIRPLVSIRV